MPRAARFAFTESKDRSGAGEEVDVGFGLLWLLDLDVILWLFSVARWGSSLGLSLVGESESRRDDGERTSESSGSRCCTRGAPSS